MTLIPKFKKIFEATEDEIMDMPLEPASTEELPVDGEEGETPEVDLFDRMANFVTNLDIDTLVAAVEDPEAAEALRAEFDEIIQALADAEEEEEGEEGEEDDEFTDTEDDENDIGYEDEEV